ncbi:tyrosine-protein phosphatase [Nocardioides sp. YJ-D4]
MSALTPSSRDRVLSLPGSHNVRDLGGLPSASGKVVRRGRIYRSDYPLFAEGGDGPAAVRSLGLRTVVDLRRGSEVAAECVAWAAYGVRYVRHPIVSSRADSWHARYPSYLETGPESVVAAVVTLMDSAGQPALFHCAAGKDRTGVVAAILLSLLGVGRDEIVADYELTRVGIAAVIARLSVTPPYDEMLAAMTDQDHEPRRELMIELLDHLDDAGGAEAWLTRHGADPARIREFRREMVN